MNAEEENKMMNEFISIVIEELIREIEMQGRDVVTTTELRKFIHNMETNTRVTGKVYGGKIDR